MDETEDGDGLGTIIQCPAGTFKGYSHDGAINFLGIRYATSERFEPPTPYRYPDGIHEMCSPCPLAIQMSSELGMFMTGIDVDSLPQEENCQYLSVSVPTGCREKLPVMVWIHGGSFEGGGCDLESYDRSPLVTECDVIVVGIGYRLGVLGFLRDGIGRLGNNGLLDIIQSLRWIKENISSFGGDSDNVTLFGESAGGEAVRCVMLSEGTADLYKRAIIQSAPIGVMSNRTAMEERMLDELNRMPVDADIEQVKRVQTSIASNVVERGFQKYMIFGPNYGVFPLPDEREIQERMKCIAPSHDLIIGSNEREVAAFIGLKKSIVAMDRSILTRWLVETIIRRITDKMFTMPAEDFARRYAEYGGKVYLYRFEWMRDYDYIGACHTSDVQLLFGAKGLNGKDISMGKKESETLAEGKPMRKMWAEFARSGDVECSEIKNILRIKRVQI
ncbi:MAG: carboxylesterase family protein [Candidatus Methanomethylophilaceae archaeon]|nr:carboxylesterase family protein [Candidatus Methanomethylophilaceae archaeon]